MCPTYASNSSTMENIPVIILTSLFSNTGLIGECSATVLYIEDKNMGSNQWQNFQGLQ